MAMCCQTKSHTESPADSPAPPKSGGVLSGPWFRLGLAALVASQTMIVSLAINLSPPAPETRGLIHGILIALTTGVIVLVGRPLGAAALQAARERRVVVEHLFLLGIAGAFGGSLLTTFTGHGSVYYEVVSILLGIYTFGRLMGDRRAADVEQAARLWAQQFASCFRLDAQGQTSLTPVALINAGDRVRVEPGGAVAIDGVVIEGTAFVLETALTGESSPVVKRTGDLVRSGSQVLDTPLHLEAVRSGRERELEGVLRQLSEARVKPAPLQREADRLTAIFLPIVSGIAAVTFCWWLPQRGWEVALFNAMAVLLVACPCALGLATPIAISGALQALARRGWRIASAEIIERLASISGIVFDKTGTLSEEELRLVDFVCLPALPGEPCKRESLFAYVAAAQRHSQHPIARAFFPHAPRPDGEVQVLTVEPIAGSGFRAVIAHGQHRHELRVGNAGVMPELPAARQVTLRNEAKVRGNFHEVWVVLDGELVALAVLQEHLREQALSSLERLREMGLTVSIMTGDNAANTARLLPVEAETGLTPDLKARRVSERQAQGERLLFVGDGINDAPALAAAHASLTLAGSALVTQAAAQARMERIDLTTVPEAIALCRQTVRGIRQNIGFAAVYNTIGIVLAAAGVLHPVVAALLMLAASFTVTGRALRFSARLQQDTTPLLPTTPAGGGLRLSLGHLTPQPVAGKEARFPWHWVTSIACMIQVVLLIYLGHATGALGMTLLLLGFAMGAFLLWQGSRWTKRPEWQMVLGMVSIGNLGMLAGWWADAGFGAIIRDGVCLCGCPNSSLGQGVTMRFTAMHAGMLLAGFPLMLALEDREGRLLRSRVQRWLHALVVSGLMLVGMWCAAWMLTLVPMLPAQLHFYLTYGAMTVGMLLAMVMSCALWQRVAPLKRGSNGK